MLYHPQESLGWKQLYYWCLTPQWITLLGHYHPQINGQIYFAKIITLIWQATLQVWKMCNDHLHPDNSEQENCSHLQTAVNQIFFQAQQDPQLQVLVKHLDPEQIISCLTHCIHQWVTNSNNHMQAHLKVVKLQAHLCTHDICQYSPRHTPKPTCTSTDKNLLCPP